MLTHCIHNKSASTQLDWFRRRFQSLALEATKSREFGSRVLPNHCGLSGLLVYIDNDPYFDYRIKTAEDGTITGIVWMTGAMRDVFERYGQQFYRYDEICVQHFIILLWCHYCQTRYRQDRPCSGRFIYRGIVFFVPVSFWLCLKWPQEGPAIRFFLLERTSFSLTLCLKWPQEGPAIRFLLLERMVSSTRDSLRKLWSFQMPIT